MRAILWILQWLLASLCAATLASLAYGLALGVMVDVSALIDRTGDSASVLVGIIAFIIALPAHFVAVAVIGPAARFILIRTGHDGRIAAAVAGSVLATIGAAILFVGMYQWEALALALPTLASGAVAALAFRRVMGVPPKPRPAPSS